MEYQREVLLPIGYVDTAGQLHRRAWLRKMRGHEEALIYDPSLNVGQLVTQLLASCLVKLGELQSVDPQITAALYSVDRNYLLLELRRFTLGDRLQTSYQCPHCAAYIAVVEDLDTLEVRQLEPEQTLSDITLTLEDGYMDRTGTLHTELTLTLPQGADEEFVAPEAEKNPLRAQDVLLLRCIKRFGTLPKAVLEAYGIKILRDLTLGDRQQLRKALNDQVPGVDLQRSIHCGECGTVFGASLDVTSFFFAVD
jgi:hypothetical protein